MSAEAEESCLHSRPLEKEQRPGPVAVLASESRVTRILLVMSVAFAGTYRGRLLHNQSSSQKFLE